jgi:enoyl-CoA hydratase/carnithine racemase
MAPPVLLEIADGIAEITLNRPEKRNALTPEMIVRLALAWDAVTEDTSIRVAVLKGAGDKAFSAGADLGRLTPLLTRARSAEDEWDEQLLAEPLLLNRAMLRTTTFYTPVVAVLRGTVVAGGMELALGCDLRVASDDSRFGLTEVRRGLLPAAGGVARISRQVATARAAEILLVGDTVSAQEALQMGLINRVVPAEAVIDTARELAQKMSKNGPLALRKAKEAMIASSGRSLEDAFGVENDCIKVLLRSNDAREGSRAFLERREPDFTGT